MLTPVKLNVFFKLFLMYLTYDEGISLGYEQKIIKRGGKTSTCEIYFNEFFVRGFVYYIYVVFLVPEVFFPNQNMMNHYGNER